MIALPADLLALGCFLWASGGISGLLGGLPTGGVNPVLGSVHVTFKITYADTDFT